MIRRTLAAATIATLGLTGLTTTTALAKDGDITVAGTCSGRSTAELKLGARPGDRLTEVEFEVDQNRNGQTWRVVIRDNGTVAVRTNAVTRAPSGSFTVERDLPGASNHRIVARATNLRTGETCVARASV